MLITLLLVGFLLAAVAVILNTMLKASTMSDARTAARSESAFILQILELNLANSYTDNAILFLQDGSKLDIDGSILRDPDGDFDAIAIGSSNVGNEIHIIPTGADRWVCITYLTQLQGDEDFGYIVRTSAATTLIPPSSIDPADHAKCFDPTQNLELYDYMTYLNSDDISIEAENEGDSAFGVTYYRGADDNNYYLVTIEAKPKKWVGGEQSLLRPFYHREKIIRTQKLKL